MDQDRLKDAEQSLELSYKRDDIKGYGLLYAQQATAAALIALVERLDKLIGTTDYHGDEINYLRVDAG